MPSQRIRRTVSWITLPDVHTLLQPCSCLAKLHSFFGQGSFMFGKRLVYLCQSGIRLCCSSKVVPGFIWHTFKQSHGMPDVSLGLCYAASCDECFSQLESGKAEVVCSQRIGRIAG